MYNYVFIDDSEQSGTAVYPHQQTSSIGGEATFICKSHSDVIWTHNGDKLPLNAKQSKTPEGNYKITIMNVKPSDEGTYECQDSKLSKLSHRDKGILLLNGIHKYGVYSCFQYLCIRVMRDLC